MDNRNIDRAVRASILEAIMGGEGLFEVSERFGISASDIIAATESEVMRRCMQVCRNQIVEAHRMGRIASPGGRPRVRRTNRISTRDHLIELSLRWQEDNRATVAAKR